MGKMRRLLAAVLVTSMLFGTSGVSYAAETIADGVSQETTEAATEDTESAAPAESDPSETVDAVTQTGAEDSSQDDSEAAEEVADTESDADDKAAASDNETDASETDKANDAAVSETGDAGNDAETPEAGSSTEVAEEVPAEVTYSAGKLEFNGDDYGKDYSVTLTYDADAEIPADAQLKVTEIEKDKEQEKYEAYLKEANAAVENSVTDARFFDIKIMVGDEEIQPKSAVKVNISYKEAIEVEEKAEVQAVHFDEEKDEPVPVEIETNNGDKVDEVEFEAKTFSVYAVLYTVDFNYTDHAFSIPGGSNIRLSELAQKLGFYAESETKEFSVQDVVNVTFTNPELVKTEKQEDGDWMLTSLKAFSTKETLTIDMANGDQFVVDVTDAQDALTVNINMYDYEDSSTVEFPGNFGGDDHVYLIAWAGDSDYIKEVTDGNTPWAIVDISDIKGHDSPYEVTVDKFSKDQWNTNFNVNYSDLGADQERLKVRVVHSNRTMNDLSLGRLLQLGNAQNESEIEEYETLWSGFGTEFPISKEHPTKQITTGENVVNFKFGNTLDHEVVLQFEGSPEAIPEGKYYAWLSAKSLNGQKTYHYVVPLHADGSSEMHIPFSGNWTEQQPFSNNWKDISAQIIAAMPGKTIQAGGNIPGENTYSITPIMKGFTCTYVGRETSVDPDNHVQHDEFVIKLTKNEYEKALDPYDVLGDGAEYGVIANKYTQANDSETNFAAKIFENETGDALKVGEKGAAGTNIVPFYVGQVTGNNNLRIGQDTTNDCDVYINNTQQDRVTNEESKITVNKIPMSQSDINEVVQGFIDKLQDSSEKYAGKTTYTPVFPEGSLKRDIDTTMFPDGKTIHINADNVNLSQGGGTIYKLPGQTIVFNMTGTDVTVSEFYVQEVNEDGTLKGEKVFSNTDGNGGSREKNLRIEEAILDHIVFNAPNAKFFKVNSGPAGLFLVPDDEAYVSEPGGSGTGWIATAGEFYQKGGEWHFFRTKRKYKSEGDFSLSGQKKITDAANNEKPFADYKSLDYEFELYKSNESGAITDADAIEKVKADESGAFSFTSLKLTQVEVPEGQRKTFYYIIKEVVPTQDNLLGVIYNAKDVHVRVVAQDDSSGNITFTVSKRTKDGEQFGEWVNVENTGADDKKVYELGDFVNTLKKGSLEVTKRVNGNDAKGTYEIAVKDTNGNYYDLDGNVTETKPYYVSFAKNDTKEWKNLIGGKYIVEEKDANAEGYTWSVSGTGVEISVGSGCVQSAEVTNTYVKHVKEHFEVTKNFTGRAWKDGDSFEFTLAGVSAKDEENNDITPIPMPSGSLKQNATSTSKTATFGDIEYSQAGTYTYSITETNGGLPGVTYDTEPHTVTVVVTMNPETKELSAEVDYDKGDESLEITNTYAASGEGEVKVKKVLEGRDWTDTDSFTFTLTGKSAPVGVETVPMPAETSITIKKSDENQTKSFGKIEFTKAGTYTYTVKETKGSLGGVSYDETEHTVTIEVVDNGQGKLVAKENTQLIQTETITNTYAATGKGEVKVKKVLNGRDWTNDDAFTFTISKGADAPADQPMPEKSEITIMKSDNDQTKSFGEITFTKKGTYTYIVKETKGSLGGVSYDETEHTVTIEVVDNGQGKLVAKENTQLIQTETITNTYTAASTKGEVKVKKVLNGRDWTDDDEFTFTLTGKSAPEGVETVPMPAETSVTIKKSDADQTKSF